jgi:uncharacterized protein YprB with RNaseH-like and TPR domain
MELHELVSKLKELAHDKGRTPTLIEFVASGISKRQILKHKYSEICKAAGLAINKHSAITDPVEVVIRPPRVLFFDIETAPIKAYAWGTWDQTIGLNQIIDDWFVLSYAAKFQGEDKFYYLDQRYANPIQDDRQLLEGIHHLLSEADVVVGHNSDRFDLKKLNARFIKHGLAPLNHFTKVDTLKIAKKYFAFTSNKLAYIAEFLGCSKKSEHGKFSGFSMWAECLKGNQEAFSEMEDYNKQDVTVLEDVYNRLAPYDSSLSFQAFYQKTVCTCGNSRFYKNGIKYLKQGAFQIYRCSNCQKTFVAKDNLIDKDLRKGFFK